MLTSQDKKEGDSMSDLEEAVITTAFSVSDLRA